MTSSRRSTSARDGSRVPVLVGGAAFDEEAKTETVAFVLDLTERKRAEVELREFGTELPDVVRID